MQSWIDRAYRYVWSNRKEAPLKTMERTHTNMQDIRNSAGITSLQAKIEKRSLQRIGHVLRMDNERPVKKAICGWLPELEETAKQRTKIRTTPYYWRRLVKEAGIDPTNLDVLTANRKTWKNIVRKRIDHIAKWESNRGNREPHEEINRNNTIIRRDLICDQCEKVCRSAGGLSIHVKRMHSQASISFPCRKCQETFRTENTLKNHMKWCQGGRRIGGSTECAKCGKLITSQNLARHRKKCCPTLPEDNQPRIYKARYVPCPQCEHPVSATNLARHLRTCRTGGEESVPSARG